TVTSRAVVAAAPEMLRTTDSVEALVRVTELTVTPLPEKATDEAPHVPDTKPVPLTVTVELVTPCGNDAGDTVATVGAALTVKALVAVTAGEKSGLVTVTSRSPVVAVPETVTFTDSVVEL